MPSRTEAARRKLRPCATGRLPPLRLFSTLLRFPPMTLGRRKGERIVKTKIDLIILTLMALVSATVEVIQMAWYEEYQDRQKQVH